MSYIKLTDHVNLDHGANVAHAASTLVNFRKDVFNEFDLIRLFLNLNRIGQGSCKYFVEKLCKNLTEGYTKDEINAIMRGDYYGKERH